MATAIADSRQPSTARCSNCNAEFNLANSSGHICAPNPDSHPSRPTLASMNSFPMPLQSLATHHNPPLTGKLPKFAPPARIDPFAANTAFMPPPPLSADIRAASPFSNPARSGSAASGRFRAPLRSATAPYNRERSPSPEFRIQQDNPFPLFPTRRVREEQAKKERQRSKSTSRSQSRDRSRRPQAGSASGPASRSNSPALPQSPWPRGAPGPRKASMGSPYVDPAVPVPPLPGQPDLILQSSPYSERQPSPPVELPVTSPLSAPPLTAPGLEEGIPLQRPASQRSMDVRQPTPSAAIKPLDAIGSARRPSDLGLSIPRSQSASGHRPSLRSDDTPPIPEAQSAAVERRQYPWNAESSAPESPVLPRTTLPGMAEHVEEEAQEDHLDVLGVLPSLKTSDLSSAPTRHRSRESASSDGSAYSVAQSTSSRSSPPTSASSFTLQNDLPRGENIDTVLSVIAEASKSEPMPDLETAPNQETVHFSESNTSSPDVANSTVSVPLQQRRRGPAKSFSRPNYARPQLELPNPAVQSPQTQPMRSPRMPQPQPQPQSQSPRDRPLRQDSQSPRSYQGQTSPGSELRSPPSSGPMSPRLPQMPRPIRPGDPFANVPPSPAGSLRRPTTPGFKGNCRGCGELIVGKSVSSADGRLTGRYHKHCFTCRTCKEPFQTADFYVIDNHPYCHRHYHTLNGSLCTVCDRGIEGPYMETDASKKFHPHCFTCKECHLILRHDYFEVDGAIYCEKHSRKTDLLGPGRRFPERRTTRLMMM